MHKVAEVDVQFISCHYELRLMQYFAAFSAKFLPQMISIEMVAPSRKLIKTQSDATDERRRKLFANISPLEAERGVCLRCDKYI